MLGDAPGRAMLAVSPRSFVRGFTLVELMITLLIVSILATMALPSFTDFIRRGQIRAASESVLNAMQLARSEAVKRNEPVVFILETREGSLAPLVLASWAVRDGAGNAIQTSLESRQGEAEVAITLPPGAGSRLTFNGLGRVSDNVAGGGATLTGITFSIPGIVLTRRIDVVAPGGQVRICDPAVNADTDPRRCL